MKTPRNLYHITETKSVDNILLNGLIPALGAMSRNLGEKEPRIWMFDSIDSVNHAHWFWEEMEDDDTPLTLLTIDSDGLALTPTFSGSETSWEWSTPFAIAPVNITIEPHLQHIVS